MAQLAWHCRHGLEVAVRGVAQGPVQGVILGPVGGPLRKPLVALALRAPNGGEWQPYVASPHQIIATWERWCAVRRAALADHPPVAIGVSVPHASNSVRSTSPPKPALLPAT